ncbi:MAG: hypothetical protein WC654_05575, partial [Patescibacteria group bacterium]
ASPDFLLDDSSSPLRHQPSLPPSPSTFAEATADRKAMADKKASTSAKATVDRSADERLRGAGRMTQGRKLAMGS